MVLYLKQKYINIYNYKLSTTMTNTLTYFLYFMFSIISPIVLNIHIAVLCTVFDSVYGYKNNHFAQNKLLNVLFNKIKYIPLTLLL